MSLDTLLREAAPAEAGFDAEDVERRVRRVRRRHRVVAGLCGVALLVGGTAAALVLLGQEDRATVVAGPRPGEPQPVPITEAALIASPWLLTGEDSASDRIPHLELFGEAPGVPLVRPGDYRLFGACDQWFGRWSPRTAASAPSWTSTSRRTAPRPKRPRPSTVASPAPARAWASSTATG